MNLKTHEQDIKNIYEILKFQQEQIKVLKEIVDKLNHKLALNITKEAS